MAAAVQAASCTLLCCVLLPAACLMLSLPGVRRRVQQRVCLPADAGALQGARHHAVGTLIRALGAAEPPEKREQSSLLVAPACTLSCSHAKRPSLVGLRQAACISGIQWHTPGWLPAQRGDGRVLRQLQVGKFDPVTREPCSEAQVRPNLGLRSATQEYLDGHAWAWRDCV
jgi:U-box domain